MQKQFSIMRKSVDMDCFYNFFLNVIGYALFYCVLIESQLSNNNLKNLNYNYEFSHSMSNLIIMCYCLLHNQTINAFFNLTLKFV